MIFQSFAASSAKPSLRKKCAKKFEQKNFKKPCSKFAFSNLHVSLLRASQLQKTHKPGLLLFRVFAQIYH